MPWSLIGYLSMAIVIVLFLIFLEGLAVKKLRKNKSKYKYSKATSVVTKRELDFYKRLVKILEKRCYIFPQMHLSSILNHKIKGQDWQSAFFYVNSKSVDYVLCEKDTLEPICAIELDDCTHDSSDRVDRDELVKSIFEIADMPLVRFRDVSKITDKEILDTIADAINKS